MAESAPIGPDDFALPLQRLPKGHAIATKHAEAVLLDRMYLALEAHYDRVLFEECQHSAEVDESSSVDPVKKRRQRAQRRAMQFITEKRYEALEVPTEVARVLRRPQDEKKWPLLLELANILRDFTMKALSVEVQT